MGRASWGGQQDLSGLFSSLINADFNDIKQGIAQTQNDAQNEQSAKDTETQAKWKAGKISDEDWLKYIKTRITGTTDPQQRGQWEQILLENQDAISDAQWETKFQQNKITVGQLMTHYRSRMGGIAENSPAYRDLASRFTQLVQFQRDGGTYYSSSGGGSSGGRSSGGRRSSGRSYGGGSGGSSSTTAGKAAAAATTLQSITGVGLAGGPTDAGYRGGAVYNDAVTKTAPDILDVVFGNPTADTASAYFTSAVDGLQATQFRFEEVFKFMKDNPDATMYTPPGGGVPISLSPESVHAMDNQYIRVTNTLADVYTAKGDGSAATIQSNKIGDFVAGPMREHNAAVNKPNTDALLALIKGSMKKADAEADPLQRQRDYEVLGATVDTWMNTHFPDNIKTKMATHGRLEGVEPGGTKSIPNSMEEMMPPEFTKSLQASRVAIDIGAHPYAYTDQQASDAFDAAVDVQNLGAGALRIRPSDLFGGQGSEATLGGGGGSMDHRLQYWGLKYGQMIANGQMSPDDVPPGHDIYTYQYDPSQRKVSIVPAVATPNANGSFAIAPVGPNGQSVGDMGVDFIMTIGGKKVKVTTPVIESTPAVGYVYRFKTAKNVDGVQYGVGDLVPSSILATLKYDGVRQYTQSGIIEKANPPGTKRAMVGNKVWYYDQRTNQWSGTPPWNLEMDGTDGNALQVTDPEYKYAADGSRSIDAGATSGDSSRIGFHLKPGLPGYIIPFDGDSVSNSQMQNWLDGEIAAGRVNPNDYSVPTADGIKTEPLGDGIHTNYFDRAHDDAMHMAHAAGMSSQGAVPGLDQIDAHQLKAQEQRVKDWERTNVGDRHGFWRASKADGQSNVKDMISQQINQYASTLGIRTGNLAALGQQFGGAAPGFQRAAVADPSNPYGNYGPGLRDLQANAFEAAANRLKISSQPRLAPLPVMPKPPPPPPAIPTRDVGDNTHQPAPPPIALTGVKGTPLTAAQRQRAMNFKPGV